MEYLDIYDEAGNHLGTEERKKVHRDALWHKTVHCWLYDNEGNVYFQIRKDKNKLYTTASGHVKANESVKEAFGREIAEEIGYKIKYEEAELVNIVKFVMDREEMDGSIFRDRAFANVYACIFNGKLTDFDYQKEELNGIVKINALKTLEILKNETGEVIGNKCLKKDGQIIEEEVTISFSDFLVNPNENTYQKYKDVLEFIISKEN